jgi:hypothetical protein
MPAIEVRFRPVLNRGAEFGRRPIGGIVKTRFAVAVLMAVLFAGSAAKISAEAAYKYWVDHKGAWICVDDDSLSGHLNHGDYTEYQVCNVE